MSKSKKEDKEINEPRTVSLPKSEGKHLGKAFSIAKVPGGWSFIELFFENGILTEIKGSEPNLKAFAINDFKKAAFHYWSELG